MKLKLEVLVKFNTRAQAADALEEIAIALRNAWNDGNVVIANDIRSMVDANDAPAYELSYDVRENDGTDIYGNDEGGKG